MGDTQWKDWKPYPGALDIGPWYKLKALIRSHLPLSTNKRSTAKFAKTPPSLFRYGEKPFRPLEASDIPLVAQIRNARRYVPSFLEHYRNLGVTRFIFVDDQSSDESLDYLDGIEDVDLYQSHLSYMQSNRGILFKEEIIETYGKNRWWVFVDIDEYLVYHGLERHGLRDVIHALERRGLARMLAPLLDMYPLGDVDVAHFDGLDSTMPWIVASAFDRSGYSIRFTGKDWEIRGGVRRRLFGNLVELTKYPLMYVAEQDYFKSIHYPRPHHKNYVPVLGNLLHFKFFSDYEDSIRTAAQEGRYFENSKHYKVALDRIQQGSASFYHRDVSEKFTNVDQLWELGFFKSLF